MHLNFMATKRNIFIKSLVLATMLLATQVLPVIAQPSVNNQQFAISTIESPVSNANRTVTTFTLPVSNLGLSTFNVQPKYEFRAAWIATVVNIDWPSKKGLSV